MTALLMLAALLVVAALALAGTAIRAGAPTSGVARSLAALESMGGAPELTGEAERPFSERVLQPLQGRALTLGRRFTSADAGNRIRRKLERAGSPAGWTVDRVVSTKVFGAVAGLVGGVLFALMLGVSTIVVLLVALGALFVGWKGPDLWLYQRKYDREERMRKELADSVDLLTISVEAGLAFDAALQQVARNTEGPLAEEFNRVLREMQIGTGRADALRGLADRSDLPDLRSFISALVQADAFGIPIGKVLRVQSAEMRVKRRQAAEEKAQQVPVKMTVPLIFFILPCLFIAVMGPAAISIMGSGLSG